MSSQEFKFEAMIEKFEICAKRSVESNQVNILMFAAGMEEVSRVFDQLGGGFSFASTDIKEKVHALQQYGQRADSVDAVLRNDVQSKNVPPKDKAGQEVATKGVKCSGSRALNRCAFVCKFLTILFAELRKDPDCTMKTALQTAYTPTMGLYHTTLVRMGVQAAFGLCSYRKDFLASLKITEEGLCGEGGAKFILASNQITAHIEEKFNEKGVSWIF